MSSKKRKREGLDEFLKKEIMTQERYDRLYGKQMPDYIGHEESRQAESGDEGAGAVRPEETRMRYEDAQIDERILRAVRELGFEEMTPKPAWKISDPPGCRQTPLPWRRWR